MDNIFKFITNCLLIEISFIVICGNLAMNSASAQETDTTRQTVQMINVTLPSFITSDPKYRVDCAPDIDEHREFCSLDRTRNRTATVTEAMCSARKCVWAPQGTTTLPSCYIPHNTGGYELVENPVIVSDATTSFNLVRRQASSCTARFFKSKQSTAINKKFSMFNQSIDSLNVQVDVSGTDKIRLTIRDANQKRYEVPVPIHWQPSVPTSVPARMNFQLTRNSNGQIGFRVIRTKTSSIIFDTSFFANGFIYDDRFLQIITTIPSQNVYGFGENVHPSFRHVLKNSFRYGIFARDQWPTGVNENLYGTHPFYMVIEPDGQAFGVLIFNSNAQDYKFDEYGTNQSMLTYRTIGGIFDILFFSGPNPEDVVRQYQSVIGYPYMPPYWALGFQLSRYGYNTLDNMKAAMERTVAANIPLDVLYGDIDYFPKRLDFTWDPNNFARLPEFIDWLHQNGMKFITILDPAIDSEEPNYDPFIKGENKSIWIKWPSNQNLQYNETRNRNMLGFVWPDGKAVFPDFLYPPARDWWTSEIVDYHKKLKFDGLWIDMNEPANFDTNRLQPWNWNDTGNRPEPWNIHCPTLPNTLDNPFYMTSICGDFLSDKTLCMIAEQTDGKGTIFNHYDVHNLYGWSETVATLAAARATEPKRSIVISRSTFPSSGTMSGHWLGDNTADWAHLKFNIIGMLEFNLFGIPYIGADICGFINNTTEEMCQRWMQLGAFNPFFRNHNGIKFIDQDPGIFNRSAVESNRNAVIIRYTLIPHLYTLFHRVHISGGTVVRSMAHVFPSDSASWNLDEQFLWGSSLLVAPVIYEGHLNKTLYLPTNDRWYDYHTGQRQTSLGEITVSAPLNYIPIYLRGGTIIPHQHSANSTVYSRKNPLYLIVALDDKQSASGDLFWDDGDSIDTYVNGNFNYFTFSFSSNRLMIEPWTYKYPQMGQDIRLNEVRVFGFDRAPARVILNGLDLAVNSKWTYNTSTNILNMITLGLDVSKKHRFVLL